MRFFLGFSLCVAIAAVGLCARGQNAPPSPTEVKGMVPRTAPADYQVHAQAGSITIAAEFMGHAIPSLEGNLSTEEYVVVETGIYGAPGARTTLSIGDFSLRINGKKTAEESQPFGLVVRSVRDPEWLPPELPSSKSKATSLSGGDQPPEPKTSPTPIKIPFEVQRGWNQRVQKEVLPEGDRALPQAGLLFFEYRGKIEKIRSLELIYSGPAGKATLKLQ